MTRRSIDKTPNRPAHRPAAARRLPPAGHPAAAQRGADRSSPSTDLFPPADSDERALPSDVEVADALGVGTHELSDEIREEERQRHADVQGDVEHGAGLSALAEEFDRRMAEGSR